MNNQLKEEKSDNEIIAEFMGWGRYSHSSFKCPNIYPIQNSTSYGWTTFTADQLEFATRWDWLMPVVEKLNEYGVWTIRPDFVSFRSYEGELRMEKQFNFSTSNVNWETEDDEPVPFIFLVYTIVVEGIKWYNSQNQ